MPDSGSPKVQHLINGTPEKYQRYLVNQGRTLKNPAELYMGHLIVRSALNSTFQVRERVGQSAVILREHLPDDFLPPPTQAPLTASDQGNLVGNFLAWEG